MVILLSSEGLSNDDLYSSNGPLNWCNDAFVWIVKSHANVHHRHLDGSHES